MTVTVNNTTPNINITLPTTTAVPGSDSISGTVYAPDGVTPVTDARVTLWYSAPGQGYFNFAYFSTVNPITGQFNFSGLSANTYKLEIKSLQYAHEYYQDKNSLLDATPIVLANGAMITGINPILNSGTTLTGTIYDLATGLSVASPTVYVVTPSGIYMDAATTYADGTYKVTVPNGTYTIFAETYSAHAGRWYGNVVNRANATTFIATGAPLSGLNVTLGRFGEIVGKVTQADGTTTIPNATIRVIQEGAPYTSWYCLNTRGNYVNTKAMIDVNNFVQAMGDGCGSSAPFAPEYWQESATLAGATPVTPTNADRVVEGINFTLAPGSMLTDTLNLQGMAPKPHANWLMAVTVTITPSAGGLPVLDGGVTTDQNGTFTINGIAPGTYTITIENAKTLPLTKTNVNLVLGNNAIDIGLLKGGDADGNNLVNILDFSILANSFSKVSGDIGFDGRADFNNDGISNITDFSVLANNFGQSS